MSIRQNIEQVKQEILKFKNYYKKDQNIELLAVSKTKPFSDIVEAYNCGQRSFGESYAQEACEKVELSREYKLNDIIWYFIGPIQSNKTRMIAEHFDWVLSCDRKKILQRLNDQRPYHMGKLNICLQINISNEQQKSGISVQEVKELAEYVSNNLPNLCLRGLMAVALDTTDLCILEDEFSQMHQLFCDLKDNYSNIDTLSLGMTQDMETAIKCGTTMVRIGTKIFGARNYN